MRIAAFACLLSLLSGCTHHPAYFAPEAALEAVVASLDIPADAAVLVGSGDIASCDHPSGPAATATLIRAVLERANEAAVFTTGDHAYPDGTPEEFRDCFDPKWGAFNARTLPTPGNHDYETPDAAGYFDYFELFEMRPEARPTGYYALTLGTWRIIALNSLLALDPESVQQRWLERELELAETECVLALWHHPLYSSAFHGYMPWDYGRDTDVFWKALLRHGADVVLNGHDHVYERFVRQDADGRPDDSGLAQFIVGTGGAGLHPIIRRRANSAHLLNDTYGVLVLVLRPGAYEWAFIGVDGVVHDRSGGPVGC